MVVTRTRLSLYYLASYLVLIGLGLLAWPHATLTLLRSNGNYNDVFSRVAGMFMSGMGLSIFGMIRARSEQQYPATLFVRTYFIACLIVFYAMTRDPFFVVLIAIVIFGFVLTLGSYLLDRKALQRLAG
jgi:small basic protein